MLALVLLLMAPADSSAAQSARRHKLPPLVPPENVVVRDRPVVVRVPVPPEILAELPEPAPDPEVEEYKIRLEGITLPAEHGTSILAFARRWATVRTSLVHPQALGGFAHLARDTEPGGRPQHFGASLYMTRAKLRRAVGKRDYFPLVLVQVRYGDGDEDEFVPQRGVTLHIERIYLEK